MSARLYSPTTLSVNVVKKLLVGDGYGVVEEIEEFKYFETFCRFLVLLSYIVLEHLTGESQTQFIKLFWFPWNSIPSLRIPKSHLTSHWHGGE